MVRGVSSITGLKISAHAYTARHDEVDVARQKNTQETRNSIVCKASEMELSRCRPALRLTTFVDML